MKQKYQHKDYERPIEIAEGIYWVGFYDSTSGLHCNPYLILDQDEAVVIDGGSRPDFSTVMMKILQTGITPSSIKALIYHHYDPDLCGSVSNFENIINNPSLSIISDTDNHLFIRHYGLSSPLVSLESVNHQFRFSSGRTLNFINTPYSHSPGSFITFDTKTKVLFTSDLFGSYSTQWDLFLNLSPDCHTCKAYNQCTKSSYCPFPDIENFHNKTMTSVKALKFAIERIQKIPTTIIAPQHGSVITGIEDIRLVTEGLISLKHVGIDAINSEI
ncbi:MAG: MBL fold metallo-hydrolase [Desulfobacterales bacterium]|nr:MBL fold metallo-hydrolase [Desulfobacterales bacterium]